MKKKIYLTKLAALSLSVIVAFSACHNSRFDKVGKETTSSIEESTDNKSTEKETETKDNGKKPAQSNSSLNPKDKKFTEQEKSVQKAFDEYLDSIEFDEIIEEAADVEIMLGQLKCCYNISEQIANYKANKLKVIEKRLDDWDKKEQ